MPRSLAVVAALACAVGTLRAQTPLPNPQEIAALIETELEAARVPGAAISVVAGDQIVARGYGIANTQSQTRMSETTLVHTGSLTKLFTALAVAATLDAQGITPESAVGTRVPGLAPRASATTFHQLLSQTSGVRDRAGDYGSDVESALGESARELTDRDFLLPAGVVFSYSNLGYALAGAALERLRKQPYADAMREVLFAPLTMQHSTLRPGRTDEVYAAGHRAQDAGWTVVQPLANDTRIWPAGYLWSSAGDMAAALSALMHQGRVRGNQALPAAVVARVMSPHTPMPNVFVGGHYGYGLMIARDRGVLVYEHGGTLPGFASILRFAPERGVGIAILGNLDNAPLRRIAQNVMAKALRLPAPAPPARTETPVTPEDMKAFVGTYRNRGTAEIAVRDGRVVLILDDGPPMGVSRIDTNRFLARPKPDIAGPEFVLQRAGAHAPAYLHFALWAYAKE